MRRRRVARTGVAVLVALMVLAGCANTSPSSDTSTSTSTSTSTEQEAGPTETPVPPTATAAPTPEATVEPAPTAEPTEVPEPTATPEPTASPEPTAVPEPTATPEPVPTCGRVTDFESTLRQQDWRVTLDGVMGGLSSGQVSFSASTLSFTGELVTSGGGFVLLRKVMFGDEFVDGTYLVLRARTDGRRYEMVFRDTLEGRARQLLHEATIPLAATDEWQQVRVELAGLRTTWNGRAVDAAPFDKNVVSEMGIIVKDGVDGEFALEIDWIDICTPA